MTPRLLHLTFAAETKISEREHKMRAWLAWQTASLTTFAFHKPAKMPSLESLTAERRPREAQSLEQMKTVFAAWAGQ